MKTVLLFPQDDWTKIELVDFLNKHGNDDKFKVGFSNYVVLNKTDIDYEITNLEKRIFVISHDYHKKIAYPAAFLLHKGKINKIPILDLNTKIQNGGFDLVNFGYDLNCTSSIYDLYKIVSNDDFGNKEKDILKTFKCDDIFNSSNISDEIKKSLLDIITLRAAALLLMLKLQDKTNILKQFTTLFSVSFTARAQIEKLILLFAKIDPNINFKRIDDSKKVRSAFYKQALSSSMPLTIKFSRFLEDVQLLDEKYRNPEIHKSGRLLKIVHSGYYTNAMNEVLGYLNKVNEFYVDICDILRTKI